MRKTIIVFLFFALTVPIRHGAPAQRLGFPASGFLPGWIRGSVREISTPAGLYEYIDGGAELYLEYFFDQLYLCEYRHADLGALTFEAYLFRHPEDAWGMFSLDTTGVPGVFSIESRGPDSTGSGVFRSWKGRCFLRAFSWSPSPAVTAALKQAVQKLLEDVADEPLPAWMESLRASGFQTAFLRGEIALRQVAGSAAPRDIPLVRKHGAVWIRADSRCIQSPALILRCADEEDAARNFHRLWAEIAAAAQNSVLSEKRGLADLQDNTTTGIESAGDFLIWIPAAADEKSCADALDAIQRILTAEKE